MKRRTELTQREKTVLEYRKQGMTLKAVGKITGYGGREVIRQIEAKAEQKLFFQRIEK